VRNGKRFMDRMGRRIERYFEAVRAATHSAQRPMGLQPAARPVRVDAGRRYRG
jgi:hypothetical protein